ncbi:MAG TPA: FAD-linked oxidase C-terminal domain-containing protein [Ktedonobacteraceae bacterium]|jgi:D-lactate dehydrogenase (cytochrome)|nr:FAD-linked oxidase C-terminal domain-containing protein [Ktedonobacteraceae bacterium]
MLQETVLSSLLKVLPRGQIFIDKSSLISYEVDGGVDKGAPDGVAFPRTADELVRLMRWAVEHNVPLVARGAGTGLSGGAVADRGGVIVEFSHMNQIREVDLQGRSAVVEAAMINLRLDERVKPSGLYFPPDPASQRASTIGGNVAENSGGPHCFKYGVTTNYVTGLEVVLANGQHVYVGGRALDYPEYDLCGLITGSEGMLALIISVSVRLLRNPPGVKTLLGIFDSIEQAGQAVSSIIAAGLVPATMEMMDRQIISIVEPFAHAGLPLDAGALLIIEIDGFPESLDAQVDEITHILEQHNGHDMRVSTNEEERYKIWLARKSVGGAVARLAPSYLTIDVTVPRSHLSEMLSEVDRILARYQLRAGHVLHAGDGNLHPMILIPDPEDPNLRERIHHAGREMVQRSVQLGGTLTGEHGVGIEKRDYMSLMHKPAELLAMWDVKQAFDPQNLLNPGKVFPRPNDNVSGPYAGYMTSPTTDTTTDLSALSKTIGAVLAPTSAEEAAQALRALAHTRRRALISNQDLPVQPGIVRIETGALTGIKTYAPDDLYVIVGAGTTYAEVQAFLAQDGKQLAMVSPWPEATIGGLISANVNAPQRMRYGAIRDVVLSTTVALADGRVIRTGRPIVKNVAGYDLTKAFIGSYGSLGLITEVTLKIMVQPRVKQTLLIPIDDLRHGLRWSRELLPLALISSAIVLYKNGQGSSPLQTPYTLAYTVEGLPEDVQVELDQVRQKLHASGAPEPLTVSEPTGSQTWAAFLAQATERDLLVRIGLPVKDLPAYLQDHAAQLQETPFIADMGNGLIYALKPVDKAGASNSWLSALRQDALRLEGYALVINQHEHIDRAGYQPQALSIMQALKQRWDPGQVLDAGIFAL